MKSKSLLTILALLGLFFSPESMATSLPTTSDLDSLLNSSFDSISTPLKLVIFLTALSFIPFLLIAVTSFTRIIIILSMLRFALGMQQTPPNNVLIALSMFLTFFIMAEPIQKIKEEAYDPYSQNQITTQEALDRGVAPLKRFMASQTDESSIALFIDISGEEAPNSIDEVSLKQLIPAFMISELKTAFKIAFVLFLPFLLIDLVVASSLMSLGMIMVPPMTISLPMKVLMFVLIDGWTLIAGSLITSFQ
ncbi:flagellar type III secretion system pore protein FliP [Kangiella sp. HZ709]|uniref:flagellar type III secretion system pore protein FliP n=1 Tax=Kangiella sp. HZ709 TaxID=2666328 RepID=UPI0012B060CC|nr:flagellar type III secretion system pore protein FliP [Kangiella sp. HZ709]MRX26840.1 flagellar type III secretion system pore protein FliP [Kangiella sp. HZ709]